MYVVMGNFSPKWHSDFHHDDSLTTSDKNFAITNRSRVSYVHNTSTASIVTPWPWNLG